MTLTCLHAEAHRLDTAPAESVLPIDSRTMSLRKNCSAADWAYGALLRAIVSLRLPPGEKLSRKHLAKWLGVSMTPLRDALLRLEMLGLIGSKAQSETRVALLDVAGLHAFQFERVAMESEVVRRLARHPDKALTAARAALQAQIVTENEFARMDLAFHESLFATVGLQHAFEQLRQRNVHLERCLNIVPATAEVRALACDFHHQILNRIAAGDGKGAVSAMRAHLSGDAATIGYARRKRPEWFA